jgi:hypothetical protein
MNTPDNKAITPASPAKPVRDDEKQPAPEVFKLVSSDGKPYHTTDPFEAAHLHRGHGYRFDDEKQRDAVLSTH